MCVCMHCTYVHASVLSVCNGCRISGENAGCPGWRSMSLRLPDPALLSSRAGERGHVSQPLPRGGVRELRERRVLRGVPDAGSR